MEENMTNNNKKNKTPKNKGNDKKRHHGLPVYFPQQFVKSQKARSWAK